MKLFKIAKVSVVYVKDPFFASLKNSITPFGFCDRSIVDNGTVKNDPPSCFSVALRNGKLAWSSTNTVYWLAAIASKISNPSNMEH